MDGLDDNLGLGVPLVTPESGAHRLHVVTASYSEILRLTLPLVLSSTGFMLMHILDAIFLSAYSKDAIAVVGAAAMAGFVITGFFSGIAGYTSTFVSQYIGANRPRRVGAAVWQGIYVALVSGVLTVLVGHYVAAPLFHWVRHGPRLEALEAQYFRIICYGAPFTLMGSALSGFFSGRGENKTLMAVQLSGFGANALLSYAAIFGHWGLPRSGSAGAALATAAAQGLVMLALAALFLAHKQRKEYRTWAGRVLDVPLLRRLLYYGSFNGLRNVTELSAWTVFLFFVGRLNETAMATTNIVWRLNGIAFFPLIGLSVAIATLVGNAQGSRQPERAERVTWRGAIIAETWMLFAAALFILLPRQLLSLFGGFGEGVAGQDFAEISALGVILLRFVALYCLLDGLNIVFVSALQGAGDTRWTLIASFILHLMFLSALWFIDSRKLGLYALWTAATAFVMLQAGVWLIRFKTGRWKAMQVIERAPEV